MATADQQLKHVTDGLALGVLAAKVGAVRGGKIPIEFGFAQAWRSWDRASSFPSIGKQLAQNVIWRGMRKSGGRRGTFAAWHMHQWVEPYLLYEDSSIEDCLDIHQDDRASSGDWVRLGGLFIATFKPDELRLETDPL